MVLLYRHEDGRIIEVKGDSSRAEVWLIYPTKELLKATGGLEAAKGALPPGFALDTAAFAPPCPACGKPAAMDPSTGMYVRKDCDRSNCACPF